MHTTPLSLLQRLQASPTADDWNRLAQVCTPLLYACYRRLGLQEADAADLVQEVFILLLNKLPTFCHQGEGSFRAWLRTVALNKWRERGRRMKLPKLQADAAVLDRAVADPLEALWDAEYGRYLVAQALRLMQAEFRPTIWRARWENVVGGNSAAQVGAELGISAEAVRIAKFRVIQWLRQELRDLLD